MHSPDCECTPCCDNDAVRDNPIHRAERQEARILVADAADCGPGNHRMVRDARGGGSCAHCPESVGPEDL